MDNPLAIDGPFKTALWKSGSLQFVCSIFLTALTVPPTPKMRKKEKK